MAQKEFLFKINGEPAKNTLAEIQAQITALDEKIKTSDINNPDFGNLVSESKKAKAALNTLQTDGVEGLKPKGITGVFKELGSSLKSIPGPIGAVTSGFGGLSKAAMGFVMNPIGAVITALVAVFAAFSKAINSTEKGTFAMNKVMGAFSGLIQPVIKWVGELAALFAEGLAKGIEMASSALSLLGIGMGDAAKDGMKLADQLNKIDEAEGDLEVARAKQNKQLAEAKEILSDTNKTYAERTAALEQIKKAETELSSKEVDLAKQRLAAAKEKARQEGESKENLDAIDAATIKLAQTEQDLAAKRRGFNREQKKLDKEQEAADKEAAAKAKAYADERLAAADKLRAAQQKNNIAAIKDETEKAKLTQKYDYENSLREIERGKYTAKEKAKLREEAAEANALALAKIQEDADAKDKAKQKELADALVNTDKEKLDQQTQQQTEFYDKLIEAAKGNADLQKKLEEQKQENIKKLQEDYDKAEQEKKDAKIKEDYDKSMKAIDDKFEREKVKLIQQGLTKEELQKELDKKELEMLEEKLAATDEKSQEYVKIQLQIAAKTKDIKDKEKEEDQRRLQAGIKLAEEAAAATQAVGDAYFATKMAKVKKGSAEELELLKKQFQFNKALQLSSAIIDGFKAANASLAQSPVAIGPVPNPAGIASLAFSIATSAANVVKIAATQFEAPGGDTKTTTPSAGSTYAEGGLLGGNLHDTGGIKTSLGELEGGEFVVNRRATMNFLPLLDQINNSGKNNGPEMANTAQQQPIIKTYVVASEMSSQQEADAKLQALSML